MKKLLLLTIIILTIGISPAWFQAGHNWPDSDFIAQQIPFILETKRMLASGAPWWSWNTFAGDNFIGAYSFYTVTSPFVWLVCLFPAGQLLWGILLSLYLKTLCTALFSFCYFRKMGFSRNLSTLGGLLYCFSSFYICNLFYFHFCEPIMVFPLLLLTEEMVLNREKYACCWLAVAAFATVFVNFYFALPSFLLGAIYLLFRSHGKKMLTPSLVGKSIGSVAVGIGMAAVILCPVILHNAGGARTGIHLNLAGLSHFVLSTVSHLCALVMPSVSEMPLHELRITPSDWGSNEPYLTLFGCLFTIIYCRCHRNWLSAMLILLAVIYLTPLNGLFSGFTNRNYTRWIYGLNIFMILTVLSMVRNNSRVSLRSYRRYVLACCIIIATGLALNVVRNHHTGGPDGTPWRLITEVILFIINCGALFVAITRDAANRNVLLPLTCICGTLNLFAAVYFYSNSHTPTATDTDYILENVFENDFDGTQPAFSYRTDAVVPISNYALFHNLPGIYSFNSSMNRKLITLRSVVDNDILDADFTCSGHRDSFGALFSVKQVVDHPDAEYTDCRYSPAGLTFRGKSGSNNLYSNNNYIPLGFTYDSYITRQELAPYLSRKDSVDIPLLMLHNLVIRDEDAAELSQYLPKGKIDTSVRLDSIASARRTRTATNFAGTSRGFSYTSDFLRPELLFFSVVSDPGFTATVDGTPVRIYDVNLGLSAIVVPPGHHHIRFEYLPPGLRCGTVISGCSLLLLLLMFLSARRTPRKPEPLSN